MNECRCPFPTLNGHAAHCPIGQNEKNINELRKMVGFDKGIIHGLKPLSKWYVGYDLMARIRETNQNYKAQLSQQFARPENAFIQDIPVSKDFHREEIFELGNKPYVPTYKSTFDIEGLQLFDFALSQEQIKKLRDSFSFGALVNMQTSRNSAHFNKLMETPIESYQKLLPKYYGNYCFEYPELKNISDRLTKSQFTQLKEAAQKATQEKMAPIMDKIPHETKVVRKIERIRFGKAETSKTIIHQDSISLSTNFEECKCQQLFIKGHEKDCPYLLTKETES